MKIRALSWTLTFAIGITFWAVVLWLALQLLVPR